MSQHNAVVWIAQRLDSQEKAEISLAKLFTEPLKSKAALSLIVNDLQKQISLLFGGCGAQQIWPAH